MNFEMLTNIVDNCVRIIQNYGFEFAKGTFATLSTAGITVVLGSLFGSLLAMVELSKWRIVKAIIHFFSNFVRGTPLLLQLYFFVFFLPMLSGIEIDSSVCVIVALVMNSSAYVSEIIRAGIQAVDKGQWEAAKSLGMSGPNMMIRIIIPQAIKNILPALGNEFIMMVKETSLCSVFFMADIMTTQKIVASTLFLTIEPLIIAALIYFMITSVLSKCVKMLETRWSISD